MMAINFGAANLLLDKLMRVLAKYEMQVAINKIVWMYAEGDTNITWLPVKTT